LNNYWTPGRTCESHPKHATPKKLKPQPHFFSFSFHIFHWTSLLLCPTVHHYYLPFPSLRNAHLWSTTPSLSLSLSPHQKRPTLSPLTNISLLNFGGHGHHPYSTLTYISHFSFINFNHWIENYNGYREI
jgi:hypothetical protein